MIDPSRLSLCIFQQKDNNFYRLADFDPSHDEDFSWLDEVPIGHGPDDPETLYNPNVLESFTAERSSDFIFLQWEPNYNKPDRPYVVDTYKHPYRMKMPEIFEVVLSDKAYDRSSFRDQIYKGIRYSGYPTKRLLLAYDPERKGRTLEAILVDSDRLDLSDNRLKFKSTPLGGGKPLVNRYILDYQDLKSIPCQSSQDRYLYGKIHLPNPDGKISVQTIDEYAANYVSFYFKKTNQGRSKRQEASALIREAFNTPEMVEEYLEGPLSDRERSRIEKAISRAANFEDGTMTKIVNTVLENDDTFKANCLRELETQYDSKLEALRKELTDLGKEKETEAQQVSQLEQQLAKAQAETNETLEMLSEAKSELSSITEEKEVVLHKLQNDIALQLGLRAVAASYPTSKESNSIKESQSGLSEVEPYFDSVSCETINASKMTPSKALSKNLRRIGIEEVGEKKQGLTQLSNGLLAGLCSTRILAVDSLFAPAIANALSALIFGTCAQHVSVPTDWCNVNEITRLYADTEHREIIVLDNVIDSVNEGLLFTLSRSTLTPIIILPVGARGNLRLIAPEVWDRILYVPTDKLTCLPADARILSKKLFHLESTPISGSCNYEPEDLEKLDLFFENLVPATALTLPACVISSVTEHSAEWDLAGNSVFNPEQWLASHETLLAYAYSGQDGANKIISSLADPHPAELFLRRLIGRNRNA